MSDCEESGWWESALGVPGYRLTLSAKVRDHWIGVEIYFQRDPQKEIFDYLERRRDAFDEAFGEPLVWERLNGKDGWRITVRRVGIDPNDRSAWPDIIAWYAAKLPKFRDTFCETLRHLDDQTVFNEAVENL